METLERISRRIDAATDLYSVVRTMRALAMTSIRQYERAVGALAEYNRTTELGLHAVLAHAAAAGQGHSDTAYRRLTQRTGVIVLGADQGMCGQFNEQIAAFMQERLAALAIPPPQRFVVAVGQRLAAVLEEQGQPLVDTLAVPTSVGAITPAVQDLLVHHGAEVTAASNARIDQVFIFHHRLQSSTAYRPHFVRMLPINFRHLAALQEERWPARTLPTFTLDQAALQSALLGQHLFVVLYRAFAESLASENAARLVAMQAAERNIEERLGELTALYHRQRQESITAELLDLVAGHAVAVG
jgi:F-type H+-transporting ATPase subunit gamma